MDQRAAETRDGGGHEPAEQSAELLAAEYVRRRLEGAVLDTAEWIERLSSDAERRRFRELVEAAESLDRLLPRQVREGTRIGGRYRILRELGAGGMGKVFAAWDEVLEREVAVKVLTALDTGAVDAARLFERESRLHAAIRHPNVAAVHEAGVDGDVHYLVMDLVDGTSLADVVRNLAQRPGAGDEAKAPHDASALREAIGRKVPVGGRDLIGEGRYFDAVARVFTEVTRTLEAAHAQGIVHRDLKPGNLMLRGDGTPVVLDFGLAGRGAGQAGTLTRSLFGSAAYVAPEQAVSGRAGRDPRSDVYQLGLVLYELLTLRRAFPGQELTRVLDDIGRGRFVAPRRIDRGIPVELEAICLKAMELDPGRRYPTAREMREDLERFVQGRRPPLAMGGGAVRLRLRDARYFLRRHKRVAQMAAALLLGGAVAWALRPDSSAWGPPWRAFVVADWSGERPVADFDAQAVAPGQVIGVELDLEEPRWLYAYALYGGGDAAGRFVCPVGFRVLSGRVEESVGETARALPGTVSILCSQAQAGVDIEGVVVFALPERDAVLEWWLRSLPRDADTPLEDAVALLERADVEAVAPRLRGRPVEEGLDEESLRRRLERVRRALHEEDFRYPFDHLRESRYFALPVRPDR